MNTKPGLKTGVIAWGVAAVVIFLLAALVSASADGGTPSKPRLHVHALDQTATLADGTTITIEDVRWTNAGLFTALTVITVHYVAGPDGHHPPDKLPTLTANGEDMTPDTGIFTTTDGTLDTPLAPGVEKKLELGYSVLLKELTNAQLIIDGEIFAGDFTKRIAANG